MPTPSETSSASPTPSTSSRITQQWPESMTSIRESVSESETEVEAVSQVSRNIVTKTSEQSAMNRRLRDDDDDDDDDDLLVTSGNLDENKGGKIGLFDVVKREFRCKTAVITNRAAYEDPKRNQLPRKPKVNFIQVSTTLI